MKKQDISPYHSSLTKFLLDKLLSFIAFLVTLPITIILSLLIKSVNNGPLLFKQKRVGKDGSTFELFKFRSMKVGAEKEQSKYEHLNEADGPVFKIRNDPRLTKIGKFLSKTGLDEFPQLINVLKGEMSLVGPRPLPVYEAKKLNKSQKVRELVKQGITSNWVVSGSHTLSFKEWMELDKVYVKKASLKKDLEIIGQTFLMIFKHVVVNIFNFVGN